MLKAIIFDFDGVIADTEPTHFEAFKKVLGDIGIFLNEKDYYEKFLAYDDKKLFEEVLKYNHKEPEHGLIKSLIDKKTVIMARLFSEHVVLFPGFLSFLDKIRGKYFIAISSGALKSEITLILNKFEIIDDFQVLTAADDVTNCKPDPEVFLKSLNTLNELNAEDILAQECLVIEDSIYGIQAAKSANMKCLAITHTYEKVQLIEADLVINNFMELEIDIINEMFD